MRISSAIAMSLAIALFFNLASSTFALSAEALPKSVRDEPGFDDLSDFEQIEKLSNEFITKNSTVDKPDSEAKPGAAPSTEAIVEQGAIAFKNAEIANDLVAIMANMLPLEHNEILARILKRYVEDPLTRPAIEFLFKKLAIAVKPEIESYRTHSVFGDSLDGAMLGMSLVAIARVAKEYSRLGMFESAHTRFASWLEKSTKAGLLRKIAPVASKISEDMAKRTKNIGPWKWALIGASTGAAIMGGLSFIETMQTLKLEPLFTLSLMQGYVLLDQISMDACLASVDSERRLSEAFPKLDRNDPRVVDEMAREFLRNEKAWKEYSANLRARLATVGRDLKHLQAAAKEFEFTQTVDLENISQILKDPKLRLRLAQKTSTATECAGVNSPKVAFQPIEEDLLKAAKVVVLIEQTFLPQKTDEAIYYP